MKKLLALLMAVCFLFVLGACGDTNDDKKNNDSSSKPFIDDIDEDDVSETTKKEFPQLQGEDEFVVVRKVGTDFEIKDITEISKYKVGLTRNTDSELIGLYYCDEENVAVHGTDHDAFSDLNAKRVDLVICRKAAAEANKDKFEIILDPIEMIELK